MANVRINGTVETQESWTTSIQSDVTANDSNKSFTVPAGEEWQILWVYVSLATTATVGNRQLVLRIMAVDTTTVIGAVRAGLVQTASTTRKYMFAPGLTQDIAFRDTDYASVSLMPIVATAGQQILIYDNAAVAAAADDMEVHMQIASRSVV